MSTYYSFNHHHHPHHQPTAAAPSVSHNHHGGRNRRAPRVSMSQNPQKQFRGVKSMRELSVENPSVIAFRSQFEASRSFDLEDDMEFCPKLLTENDVSSSRSPLSRVRSPGSHALGSVAQVTSVTCSGADASDSTSWYPSAARRLIDRHYPVVRRAPRPRNMHNRLPRILL